MYERIQNIDNKYGLKMYKILKINISKLEIKLSLWCFNQHTPSYPNMIN